MKTASLTSRSPTPKSFAERTPAGLGNGGGVVQEDAGKTGKLWGILRKEVTSNGQ